MGPAAQPIRVISASKLLSKIDDHKNIEFRIVALRYISVETSGVACAARQGFDGVGAKQWIINVDQLRTLC
jgi:hypothetical protein